ncbi:MAG: SGNH/GDSL hydrolase family protein [bacterium]
MRSGGINYGDTIEFSAGTYTSFNGAHQNIIPSIGGDTQNGAVTIKAASEASVIFNFPNNISTAWLLPQTNNNFIFEDIDFTNSNAYAYMLFRLYYNSDLKFKNCIIDRNNVSAGLVYTTAAGIISTVEFENTVVKNSNGGQAVIASSTGSPNIQVKFTGGTKIYEAKGAVYVGGPGVKVYARDSIFGGIKNSYAAVLFTEGVAAAEIDIENCIFAVGGKDALNADYSKVAVQFYNSSSAYLIDNLEKWNFKNNKLWSFDTLGVDLYSIIWSNYLLPYDRTNVFSDPGFTAEEMRAGDFSGANFSRPANPELISDKVAFSGDSIMYGVTSDPGGISAYQLFNSETGITVGSNSNSAISGLHIHGLRYFIDHTIFAEMPRVIFLAIGLNNLSHEYNVPVLATAADIANSIIEILERIEYWGIRPIWLGVESKAGDPPDNSTIEEVNSLVETGCDSNGWECGSILRQMKINTDWKTEYYTDIAANLHPDSDGHALIEKLAEYLYFPKYTIGTDDLDITGDIKIYSDGKFRYSTATSSAPTASFSVVPSGGSFYSGDHGEYMDITINTWQTSVNYNKQWTATSTIATTTVYTIGDLAASTYYDFKLDGAASTTAVTGETCANGVCKTDGSGNLTFTYIGGYSTHIFALEKGDNTAPARSSGALSTLPAGTVQKNLTLDTDETAICKYSTVPDTAYYAMANTFSSTGGTSHNVSITDLQNGQTYIYYARCLDGTGNYNTSDYTISFSIAPSGAVMMPSASPSNNIAQNTPADADNIKAENNNSHELKQVQIKSNETSTTIIEQVIDKIAEIIKEAILIAQANVNTIISQIGGERNLTKEIEIMNNHINGIEKNNKDNKEIKEEAKYAMINFITYGTATTKNLGEAERAAVIKSFRNAYDKLPQEESEWEDVLKIANGRWPSARNEESEKKAKIEFKKIYKREADMDNANDNAAVTNMAYGLRPLRKMESEREAIKIFNRIYGKNPGIASDWHIVRAIAYSGAQR